MLSTVFDSILHNQVVTGLSFTALLGAVAYQLREVPRLIHTGVLRFFTVQLSVVSSDPAFDWMDRWLAHQPYSKRAKMLTLRAHGTTDDVYEAPDATSMALSPGTGLHIFWWRHRPVFLHRHFMEKSGDTGSGRRIKPTEMFTLRTIGRSQQIVRRLVDDMREFSVTNEMVPIRVWGDHYWNAVRGKAPRQLDTIILHGGQIERIIADLDWFRNSRPWYAQRGIPYRRGYLFAGPPGTGKTSLVLALAGYMNRPICVLSLGAVPDDEALFSAFNTAPPNAILLIEDIDCAFPTQNRQDTDDKDEKRLTKAGLLNAIDGITTPDGRIFIMTTNYPDRLDAALVRPGRADVHEHFEYLGPSDQQRMAACFYDAPFTPVLLPVSPAELQAVFMLHPNDPKAAHTALVKVYADQLAVELAA